MPTFYDDRFLAVANNIVDKFGIPATLTIKNEDEGNYNPVTMEFTEDRTEVSVDKVSPPIKYSKEEIDGSLIQVNDFKVYVPRGVIQDVSNTDTIELNGIKAIVKGTMPVYSGEEVAVWILQCRRG